MITNKPEVFYKIFPYKYWLLKAEMLNNQLANLSEGVELFNNNPYLRGSEKDLEMMLKYELHFTFYHQVEALFELIYALKHFDNKGVWINLSKPEKGHPNKLGEFIKKISEDSKDIFEKEGTLSNGDKINFIEWLIYETLGSNFDKEAVKSSVQKTKTILGIIARDLSPKDEYNAFKHGLRVLPLWEKFVISEKDDPEKKIEFDLSGCYTYLKFSRDRTSVEEIASRYNTDIDLKKIYLTTIILGGIIESRKQRFYGDGQIQHFTDFDISELLKEEEGITSFKSKSMIEWADVKNG